MKTIKLMSLVALAACTVSTPLLAGLPVVEKNVVEVMEEKTLCESVFDLATLYSNKENPYIQNFALIGRYNGQYYWLDSNQGNADDWDNRRTRLGASAELFNFMKLKFSFNLDVEGNGRFFQDWEDYIVELKLTKEFKLSIGKLKAPVTEEWRASSNDIITIERSQFINQAVPTRMGGVMGTYSKNGWVFELGAFTNTIDEDWAYATFDGGFSAFTSVGYQADFGTTRLEYLYSDIDSDLSNNATRGYEGIFSLVYKKEWDKLALVVNPVYAIGADSASDVYGFILLPSYMITDKLQAVLRYQLTSSDSDSGVTLQKRYERNAPDLITSKGDFYQALYGGLNYYICGNNLKVMAGAEYADMSQAGGTDFNSWTFFTAVRVSF